MRKDEYVSASEVGKTAWCPHGASLIGRGAQPDKRHAQRTERGTASHENLTRSVIDAQGQDQRCFVASYALGGNHPTTRHLRDWRDRVLMVTAWGRMLVAIYYTTSPILIRIAGSSRRVRVWSAFLVKRFARSLRG